MSAPTAAPALSSVHICNLQDIPVLGSRVVSRPGLTNIALFRNAQDQVFALLDECPHKGGPLSQGIVHGTSVTCPLHAWKIDLANGQALAPDEGCAARFDVELKGEQVYLSF